MKAAELPSIISPMEIASILYRRRWWLILPALVGLAAAVAVAMLSQPLYRSSATLLIDSQQISTSVSPPRSPIWRTTGSPRSASR